MLRHSSQYESTFSLNEPPIYCGNTASKFNLVFIVVIAPLTPEIYFKASVTLTRWIQLSGIVNLKSDKQVQAISTLDWQMKSLQFQHKVRWIRTLTKLYLLKHMLVTITNLIRYKCFSQELPCFCFCTEKNYYNFYQYIKEDQFFPIYC